MSDTIKQRCVCCGHNQDFIVDERRKIHFGFVYTLHCPKGHWVVQHQRT